MRRAHDVGGASGFGPIAIEKNEPVFHKEWEGRVFGMMTTIGHRTFPMRPAIESIDPATYLASSYYQKWLNALEIGFVQSGTFTDDELGNRVELHRANPGTPVSQITTRGLLMPQGRTATASVRRSMTETLHSPSATQS